MQLFVGCALLLLYSIQCSCGSLLQMEKLGMSSNRNVQQCLETLMSLGYWTVHDFSIIFDDMDLVDDYLLQKFPNFRWKLHSVRNNSFAGFSNAIFFAKNFDSFEATLSTISINRMDSRAKLVISIAENFASLDEIKIASKGIPEAMWKLDKVHVLYLVPCKQEILAMTYLPFARNCQVGELEILDIWSGKKFAKQAELFPEKMLDIHGCVQNHSVSFTSGAALHVHKDFTETGKEILGGIGGRLITIAAEKMNMKLNLMSQSPELWTLHAAQVARGESLFALSGTIPLAGQSEILDLDSGYMEESFGFGYIIGSLDVSSKNLIWPLSSEVWQCIIYTGLLFAGLLFIANRCHLSKVAHEKLKILHGFGIFLGTTQVLPRSYLGRYLFGMWIVYSYLINTSYNSGLVSFLTTPNQKSPIENFEDLLADGIDFGGGQFHRELYHDPSDPIMMKIYNNFKIWSENESTRLLMNRQCVTGVLNSYVYMFNSDQTDFGHQIRMTKEKACTFQVPIPMRRGSPFTFGVRRYISRAIQGGFHEYWLKYYTRKSSLVRNHANTPTAISMQHVRGILYLHLAGLVLSSLVFLGEVIFHKYFGNRQ